MERAGLSRWLLLGLAAFLLITFLPKLFGSSASKTQPLQFESFVEPLNRAPKQHCDLWGPRFRAQLGSHGAALEHFELTTAKYQKKGAFIDVATTPDVESRQQLAFHFRNEAALQWSADGKPPADSQVDYDAVDWTISKADGKTCEFSYRDAKVALTKVVSVSDKPYELLVSMRIENLAKTPLRHAATVETVAWRTHAETENKLMRVSPFATMVECIGADAKPVRKGTPDFEPKKFEEAEFAKGDLNRGDWYVVNGTPSVVAVSNAYFAHAITPLSAPTAAQCQLQIEQRWDSARFADASKDPRAGAMYRARLAYAAKTLAPGESAEYRLSSYVGPKERELLAAVGGADGKLNELIDLGFFAVIAKVLVSFLLAVHGVIPNWGLAIVLLTITARTLLFPLSVPMIKSQVKMREIKPEMDAMNEKFKDDAQARGLAQMELWRKHEVNPMKGCVPQMASMPVWFALYTTLQTAVELYNIPFLWFPDLSQPDPFYVLPFVIGSTSFMQQKLMPVTGGDPAQQKMMLYFMPAMFTVFMLFLPAGLGVYMFTNGLLGILQQQLVERHVRKASGQKKNDGQISVRLKEPGKSPG